jgi:peptidyl-prolyl cis-trans isomerase SurA
MRLIYTILLLALPIFVFGQREMIDDIIAQVGEEIVLLSEVEEQYSLISEQQGNVTEDAKCQIIDQLLSQKLILNQAKLDSVVVADEEIETQLNARIDRILSYMQGDVSQFEAYYGKSVNEVKEEFRQDLRSQITTERMQATILGDVKITPAEVKDFFSLIPKDSLPYFNSEVELGELIFKPSVNDEERLKAMNKAQELRDRIVNDGEDFAELASQYSEDLGSAKLGGDLGWAKRNTFVPEFEASAYTLEKGEISELVETQFGFHVLQLIERRGNTVKVRHILIKPVITQADLDLAAQKVIDIREEISVDSITFSRAVKRFGDDSVQSYNNDGVMVNPKTGNGFFEIGDLEPDIYFAIDTLAVGEMTEPLGFTSPSGESMFRLILLKSRTKPHKADLAQDYSRIQKAALESKKNTFINNWVEEKIESTFIEFTDPYGACNNINDRWIRLR